MLQPLPCSQFDLPLVPELSVWLLAQLLAVLLFIIVSDIFLSGKLLFHRDNTYLIHAPEREPIHRLPQSVVLVVELNRARHVEYDI